MSKTNMVDKYSIFQTMADRGFTLIEHQKDGINWMLDRELCPQMESKVSSVNGGLLCDDPGLGKTIQTCGVLLGNKLKRTLIVLPISVMGQWKDTIEKILPDSRIHIHHGSSKIKSLEHFVTLGCDIVLTTIGLVSATGSILQNIPWNRVVIDEVHAIRNPSSKAFIGAKLLKSNIKWGLTGTPIQNSIKDIQTLYRYVFSIKGGINITNKSLNEKQLAYLNSIYLKRRTKSDVEELKKLDKNIEFHDITTEFETEEEAIIYTKIKNNTTKELKKITDSNMSVREQMVVIFELILRLRQVSIHPQIAINSLNSKFQGTLALENFEGISSKYNQVLKLAKEKASKKQNTIVFCYFREEMTGLSKLLEKNGIGTRIYNGSMSMKQKEEVLRDFTHTRSLKELQLVHQRLHYLPSNCMDMISDNIPKVLLIQIKCGAVGLNLQQFNNIVFTSPDWNPTNQFQAIARAHRIGQNMKINVYNINITHNQFYTIDDRIIDIQNKKNSIIQKILKENIFKLNHKHTHHNKIDYLDYTSILS